jgi:hypothetical protein
MRIGIGSRRVILHGIHFIRKAAGEITLQSGNIKVRGIRIRKTEKQNRTET